MDFDTLIAFVFFLIFFVLPSIIKQIQLKKKKKAAPKATKKKKKSSFFGGIRNQIQQFIKELEQQAQQQKKAKKHEENVWDALAEDEWEKEPTPDIQVESKPEPEYKTESVLKPVTAFEAEPQTMTETDLLTPENVTRSSRRLRFRQDPLQNAIVLSEILSKPVALKSEP